MHESIDLSVRTETALLIAFADLTRYTQRIQRSPDDVVAETINELYRRVSGAVSAAGGRVVKFIGDATLIVFPEELADTGVETLLALKRDTENASTPTQYAQPATRVSISLCHPYTR